jgi:hypothetical protein
MAMALTARGADRDGRIDQGKPSGASPRATANSEHSNSAEIKWRRDVLNELRAIRQLLEQRPAASWTDADAVRFLSAVAGSVKGCAFTVAMLLAQASVDLELRDAVGTLTCRQLGKRLRSCAGRWVGGYRVERVKREGSGTLWIVQVRDLHTHPSSADDSGGR